MLSINLNRIDDKAGAKFCNDLKENNKTLTQLNLRGNSLEHGFAKSLAELILDTALTRIDVSCNFITRADAHTLKKSLEENSNIIEFDIRNN